MAEEEFNEKIAALISDAATSLEEAEARLLKAEEAGIDVAKEREEYNKKFEEFERLKAVYI